MGLYAIISPGVRPIISFASAPTAKMRLSISEMATTEGSFNTTPRPGTNTNVLAVPKSMPSLGVKNAIAANHTLLDKTGQIKLIFYDFKV
jgi:hypothetical protein